MTTGFTATDGKDLDTRYLRLSGGQMTGAITKSTVGEELQLCGGTGFGDGACIALYGGDCTSGYGYGHFLIRASTSDGTFNDLVGKPDGTLIWAGKNVLTELTGICVKNAWRSGANWYRKWSDGWIEQGGLSTSTGSAKTITLNVAFTTTDYTAVVTWQGGDGADYCPVVNSRTTTNFTTVGASGGAGSRYNLWYACGF